MFRRILPLALALLVVADASAQDATHIVSITYERVSRTLSAAQLTVSPKDSRARAPWRGAITEVAVLSTNGLWVRIDELRHSGGETSARAVLPPVSEVAVVLIRGERGPWVGWKIEEGEANYSKVEWTLLAQDGTEDDKEPEVDELPDCDFSDCSMIAVRDPWTCECIEPEAPKDPWPSDPETLTFGI